MAKGAGKKCKRKKKIMQRPSPTLDIAMPQLALRRETPCDTKRRRVELAPDAHASRHGNVKCRPVRPASHRAALAWLSPPALTGGTWLSGRAAQADPMGAVVWPLTSLRCLRPLPQTATASEIVLANTQLLPAGSRSKMRRGSGQMSCSRGPASVSTGCAPGIVT